MQTLILQPSARSKHDEVPQNASANIKPIQRKEIDRRKILVRVSFWRVNVGPSCKVCWLPTILCFERDWLHPTDVSHSELHMPEKNLLLWDYGSDMRPNEDPLWVKFWKGFEFARTFQCRCSEFALHLEFASHRKSAVRGLALRLRRFFPGIFASLSVTSQFGLALCVFKCPCIL